MTSFSDDDVRRLARLARLSLDDAELARMKGELSSIVSYVEALAEVDVDGVEPMSHAVPTTLRLRDDVVTDVVGVRAIAGAASVVGGLVRVPKVIE